MLVVGTDHHPFDRVVGWADDWAASHTPTVRVVIQYGTSRPPSSGRGPRSPAGRPSSNALMAEAAAVVCHGGPGTIMGAREAGLCRLRSRGRRTWVSTSTIIRCGSRTRDRPGGAGPPGLERGRARDLLDRAVAGRPGSGSTSSATIPRPMRCPTSAHPWTPWLLGEASAGGEGPLHRAVAPRGNAPQSLSACPSRISGGSAGGSPGNGDLRGGPAGGWSWAFMAVLAVGHERRRCDPASALS